MRSRVLQLLALIVRGRDHSTSVYDDSSDWNFAQIESKLSLLERQSHEIFVHRFSIKPRGISSRFCDKCLSIGRRSSYARGPLIGCVHSGSRVAELLAIQVCRSRAAEANV